jgi:hypothetical protein
VVRVLEPEEPQRAAVPVQEALALPLEEPARALAGPAVPEQ